MLNLDHQNPSTVRRDESSVGIANHIKKEEQLRQKLDNERASKRELVERLHAEKEEIKHKSKLVVDMFKQKISETETQLMSSQHALEFVSHRSSLTGELLRDHVAKWKLWNESLQCCDNMEVFAEYLLNQPMKFISSDKSATLVTVSDPSEIPTLMITELDQILKYISDPGLSINLECIPYVTLVARTNPAQSMRNRKESFVENAVSAKQLPTDETKKYNNASPGRRRSPLSLLNVNTGTFSANNSPMQSPVGSARLQARPPTVGSKGTSKKRSSGIGMPGTPSFSFFDDAEDMEASIAANTTVVESEQLVLLTSQLSQSRVQVESLTEQKDALNQALAAERTLLAETQQNLQTERVAGEEAQQQFNAERIALESSLTSERDARAQAEQKIACLTEHQTSLLAQLDSERAALVDASLRVAALEKENVSVNEQLVTEQKARVRTEQEMDTLQQTVTKLDAKVQRLKSALEKSKVECGEVREALQRERDTHANLQLRHTIEQESAAQAAARRASEFVAEIEQLKALAATPAATIAALEHSLTTRDEELKELVDRLAEQTESMRALEARAESQLSTLRAETQERLQAEIAASEVTMEALRAQLQSATVQSDHWYISTQRSNEESMGLALLLEDARNRHSAALAALSAQLENTLEERNDVQQALQASETHAQALENQLAGQTVVVGDLKRKLGEMEEAHSCLQQELSRSEVSLRGVNGQMAMLEQQMAELQSRCADNDARFVLELQTQRLSLETVLQEAKESHQQALSAIQETLRERVQQVEELTAAVQANESEIQLLSASLLGQSAVKELLVAAQSDADAQAVELQELRRQFAEQTEEVAVKRNAMVARIALLTEDVQNKEATVLSLRQAADRAHSENASAMEALQRELQVLNEEVQKVRQGNAAEAEVAVVRMQELQSAQSEILHLQGQLTALEAIAEAERCARTDEMRRSQEELAAHSSKHNDDLIALQAHYYASVARCQELETSLQEQHAQIASFEAQRITWQSTAAERDQAHALSAGRISELSHQLQQSQHRSEELVASLSECEAELEVFRECHGRVSEERDAAQEQWEAALADLEASQSELALLQSRTEELEEECVALRAQLDHHLADREKADAVRDDKLTKLQQRLIAVEEESSQRIIEADVLRGKLRECETLISETDSTVAKRNMEIDLLQQSLRETEHCRDAAELKFKECEESFHRVVGKLEVRIADFLTERELLQQSLSELRAESETQNVSAGESQVAVAQLEQEAARYRQEITSLSAELTAQRQAVLVAYADLNTQSTLIEELESQLTSQSVSSDANKLHMQESLQAEQVLFHTQLLELQHHADHAVASLRSNLLSALALEQEEVRTLATRLESKTAQCSSLSGQREELQQRVESLLQECDTLQAQVVSLEAQHAAQLLKASKTNEALHHAEQQVKDLNESIVVRNQEIATLQASLKTLQMEQLASRKFVVEQEESIYGLQLCVQAAEQDRLSMQRASVASIAEKEQIIAETTEQLSVAVLARDSWEAKHCEEVQKLEDLRVMLDTAEQRIQDLQASAEAASASHHTVVEELLARMAGVEQRNAVVVQELEARLRGFEALGADSSEQLRVILEQRDQARVGQASLHQQVQRLSLNLAAVARQLTEKEDAHSVLIAQFNVTTTSLEEALQEAQSAQASLQEQRMSSESLVLELRESISRLEAEVKLDKEQLLVRDDELTRVKADAAAAIAALSARVEELSQQAAASALVLSQLEQHRDHVCHELQRSEERVRSLETDLTETRSAHAESVAALESSSTQLEMLLAEKVALLSAASEKQDELSTLLGTKCAEHNTSVEALGQLQGKVNKLEATIAELEDITSTSAARIVQLEGDLHSAQQDCVAKMAALHEAETAHTVVLESLLMRIADIEQQNALKVHELQSRLQDFETQSASSSEQLRSALEQRDAVQVSLLDAEKKLAELNATHLATEQSLVDVQSSAVVAQAEHAAAVDAYVAQIQDLQSQLEEKNEQCAGQQSAADELQCQLTILGTTLEHQTVEHNAAEAAFSAERAQFKQELEKQTAATHRTKMALNAASLECVALSTIETALLQDNASLLSAQASLKDTLRVAESAVRQLSDDLLESHRDCTRVTDSAEAVAASLRAEVEGQQLVLQDLQEQLATSQEFLRTAQQALAEAECVSTAASVSHTATVQEMQARLGELEGVGANSSEQLRITLEQRDSLQQTVVELRANVSSLQNELLAAQQALRELEEVAEFTASSYARIAADTEAEVESLRLKLNHQLQVGADQRDSAKAQQVSLLQTIACLQEQLTMQREDAAAHAATHLTLTSTLEAEVVEKDRALHDTKQALSDAVKRVVVSNVEFLAFSAELTAAKEREVFLLAEVAVLRGKVLVAERAVRELDACLMDQGEEFSLLRVSSSDAIASLHADLAAAISRNEEINALLQEKEIEYSESIETLHAALLVSHDTIAELKSSKEEMVAGHASAIAELAERVEELGKSKAAAVGELENKLHEMEIQGGISSEKLQLTVVERDALHVECESLKQFVVACEAQMVALQAELAEGKVASATLCANSASLPAQLVAVQQELETARSLHNTQVEHLERHIATLRDNLSEREADCVSLQEAVSVAEVACMRLWTRLYTAEAAVRELDLVCIESSQQYDVQLSASAVIIAGLTAEVQAAESRVSLLREKVVEQNEAIHSLQNAHSALQHSMESSLLSHESAAREREAHIAQLESEHTALMHDLGSQLRASEAREGDITQQLRLTVAQRDALVVKQTQCESEIAALAAQLSTLRVERDDEVAAQVLLVTSLQSKIAENAKHLEEQVATAKDLHAALLIAEQRHIELCEASLAAAAASTEKLTQSEERCVQVQLEVEAVCKSLDESEARLLESRAECERLIHSQATAVKALRAELKEKSACLLEISQALASAEQRMEQTSTEMKTYESLLVSAQEQIASCSSDIHRLESELRDAEATKSSLEESVAVWRAENAQLEDQRCSSELQCSSLQSNLLEVEKNLRSAQKESAALTDKVSELEKEFKELTASAQASEESLQVQVTTLRKELLQAQEELKNLAVASVEGNDQRNALEMLLQESKANAEARALRIVELETTVEEFQKRIAADEAALQRAEEARVVVCVERDSLQVQQQNQDFTIHQLQESIEQLQAQLSAVSMDSVTYIDTIDRLQADLAHSHAQVETLTEAALSSKAEYQSQVAAVLREVAIAQDEVHELNRVFLQGQARQQELEEQLCSLSDEVDVRNTRMEELHGTVERLTASLTEKQDALTASADALELAKSTHEGERTELLEQIDAHATKLQHLQEALDQAQSEIEKANAASSTLVRTIDNLREESFELTTTVQVNQEAHSAREAALLRDLSVAQEQLCTLHVAAEQAAAYQLVLEEQLRVVTEESTARNARIGELESEVSSLQALVATGESTVRASDQANEALRVELAQLQAVVDASRTELQTLQADAAAQSAVNEETIRNLNAQLADSLARVEHLTLAAQQTEEANVSKVASLLNEIAEAQGETKELSLAAQKNETLRKELIEQLNTLSTEAAERTKRTIELEQIEQELHSKISATEDTLHVSELALQQTTSAAAALTAERDDLLSQVSLQNASIENLRAELEALQTQLAEAVAASEVKAQAIEQQDIKITKLLAHTKTLAVSADETSQLHAVQIESLQYKITTAQNDLQELTDRAEESQFQCRSLQKQLEEACGQSEDRARRVAELEATLVSHDALIAAKGVELENVQLALQQAQLNFSAERESLQAELSSQALTVANLTRTGEELQVLLSAAAADATLAEERCHAVREQLATSRDACSAAEAMITSLTVSNTDLCVAAEERVNHLAKLEAEQLSLRAEAAAQDSVLKTELSCIVDQLKCAEIKVLDLTSQLQSSKDVVDRLEELLHEKEREIKTLQCKVSDSAVELERVQCDLSTAATLSQGLQSCLDASEKTCAAIMEKEVHQKEEIVALQASVSQLAVELSAKDDAIQELKMQCDAKSATITSLEQQLQAMSEDRTDTEKQLYDAHIKAIYELKIQLSEASAQLDAARASLEQNQQQLIGREAELAELQQIAQKLREELASAQACAEEEQSAHEVENLSLNGRIAENQFLINELRVQIESLTGEVAQSKQTMDEMEANLRSFKAKQESSENQVLALEQEKTVLHQSLSELQTEFSQAMANLSAAESARATATAKLSLDQASLHEMATQLVEAKAAQQQCQTRLSEQKGIAKALQTELSQKTEKLLLLDHRLAERASAESTLQTELQTMEQHEATLKAELKRAQAELSIMSARLHDATIEISHLKDTHANELTRWRHDIHDRESALQELNHRLLQQMELNEDLKRLLQEENMVTNKLKRELNERNTQLSELTVDHGVLSAQEHIHSKEVQALKAQLHSAEVTVADLKQELHVLTLESANLAVSVRQRQDGIQKLSVTLTEKEQKTQQLHASSVKLTQELTVVRNKLQESEEKSRAMEMQLKTLTGEVDDLRQKVADQEELMKQERVAWETNAAELNARIQEGEFVIQELNGRLSESEKIIAGLEKRAMETASEKMRLSSEFSSIHNQLQSNLAEVAQEKQSIPSSPVNIVTTPSVRASGEIIASLELLIRQKDDMLKAHTANWNQKVEDLEAHTAQRVESIREALETQFEAQVAAQHIESRMLEDKIATLEGLLSAAQQELHQCHASHPEPSSSESDAVALVTVSSAEEIRCLQAGVTRLRAKVASKSKQILILNQQMLKDRQNFQKLKRSLVKLDGLKAAVFANNFNPAVPAPPLPANQVSELFHLGMEEATKKMELKQQKLLLQQQEEFQSIRKTLENSLWELEKHHPVRDSSEGVAALTGTISALHAELRDKAAACQESQRVIQALRQRNSAKEAAHYLALSEKTVECNALRTTLQDIEGKLAAQSCALLPTEPSELQQQAIELRNQLTKVQMELQVMTQRQAEGQQKFQRAVRTIKVLETRSESLKEECVATNGEILRLHQKASSKKRSEN